MAEYISFADDGEDIESHLDKKLLSLNPHYPRMRQAAWESLGSNNPDKYRQSIISMRELLRMVLEDLAPDQTFDSSDMDNNGRITRKKRLKKILGKSGKEMELIENLAGTVDAIYNEQSKLVHKKTPTEAECNLALSTTECVLTYILDKEDQC